MMILSDIILIIFLLWLVCLLILKFIKKYSEKKKSEKEHETLSALRSEISTATLSLAKGINLEEGKLKLLQGISTKVWDREQTFLKSFITFKFISVLSDLYGIYGEINPLYEEKKFDLILKLLIEKIDIMILNLIEIDNFLNKSGLNLNFSELRDFYSSQKQDE